MAKMDKPGGDGDGDASNVVPLRANEPRDKRTGKYKNPHPEKKCGTNKTDGSPCNNSAGFQTDHPGYGYCKYHGGNTPTHAKHAAKEQVRERLRGMGDRLELSPEQALMAEVYRSAGHAAWLERQIADWEYNHPRELLLQVGVNGMEKSAVLKVYQEERAHLARVAKMAIDAGIAERVVKLAESQAALINTAITNILTDLGLDVGDTGVRAVVSTRLSEMVAAQVA